MALITIEDLEAASGQDISTEDEARYQWYIDVVSEYVMVYTGQDFAFHEDEELICQADGRGIIEIFGLTEVSEVEEWDSWTHTYTSLIKGDYRFDGMSKILYLVPRETYRITVSHGYSEIPTGIKGIVTDLVLAGTGLDSAANGGLKSYRIGDKEEVYGVSTYEAGGPIISISSLMRKTLDAYAGGSYSWRL